MIIIIVRLLCGRRMQLKEKNIKKYNNLEMKNNNKSEMNAKQTKNKLN